MACRFYGDEARSQGRVSQGVKGMSFKFGDDRVAGMIVTNNADTQILTVSRHGMGKRTRMGTAEKIPDLDSEGVQKTDKHDEPKMKTDGYRRTKRGAKGVKTMMMDDNDEIVTVRHIPDLDDQLFLLAESGMMIRIRASQTKETTGRVTRGTRLMELRARNDDGKRGEEYSDKIIGVARLPAALLDDESNESETDDIISSEEE
jgi:DNA gyrase subunit A